MSKRWIRERMAATGEGYQKTLMAVRKEAEQRAKEKGITVGQAMAEIQREHMTKAEGES